MICYNGGMNHVIPILLVLTAFSSYAGLRIGVSDCLNPENRAAPWYRQALAKAGHTPVLVPGTTDTNALRRIVAGLDALVMTGGEDVEPWRYGERPSPRLGRTNPRRDACDFALLAAARERRLPLVGFCRGVQEINVFFGGTLVQDIPSEIITTIDHGGGPWAGDRTNAPAHKIVFRPDSRLRRILGVDELAFNSHHHQAVERVADGFRIAATAPDGVIEAIEGVDYPAIAFQGHPEALVALEAVHPDFRHDLLLKIFTELLPLAGVPATVTPRKANP